ncbi:MAG: UDP-N-acetylmuramate dehydrogenase [Solirubrobacterales bacterium]|nr:UDP-N-acetylmuramate dehydrogenase [Solirubrobacterales bacterium]
MAEAGTNIELAPLTTLRLGGPAERLVKVEATDELIKLVRTADAEGERIFFLAGGSNVVIADDGVPGTTVWIRTGGVEERELEDGRVTLTAAAGESWDSLVERSVEAGLSGIECLSGIPGSVGATPIQNVGAYGQEVSQTISSVLVLDRETGEVEALAPSACGFGYRSSRFKGDPRYLVLAVEFALEPSGQSRPVAYAQLASSLGVEVGERVPLEVARETVLDLRRSKSMVVDPADPDSVSAGSFFTNPLLTEAEMAALAARAQELLGPDDRPPSYPAPEGLAKTSAAWLIERTGFTRGFGDGPIGLSRNHTLAIVNRGGGTTSELVAFAHGVADRVEATFGVPLTPEPVFVGHSW